MAGRDVTGLKGSLKMLNGNGTGKQLSVIRVKIMCKCTLVPGTVPKSPDTFEAGVGN